MIVDVRRCRHFRNGDDGQTIKQTNVWYRLCYERAMLVGFTQELTTMQYTCSAERHVEWLEEAISSYLDILCVGK